MVFLKRETHLSCVGGSFVVRFFFLCDDKNEDDSESGQSTV